MNTNFTSIFKITFSIIFLITGCETKSNKQYLSVEKFSDFYVDLITESHNILETNKIGNDTTITSLFDKVLSKHKINRDDINQTVKFYNDDIPKWKEFYEKVILKLQQKRVVLID